MTIKDQYYFYYSLTLNDYFIEMYNSNKKAYIPKCVYYDQDNSEWSTDG